MNNSFFEPSQKFHQIEKIIADVLTILLGTN